MIVSEHFEAEEKVWWIWLKKWLIKQIMESKESIYCFMSSNYRVLQLFGNWETGFTTAYLGKKQRVNWKIDIG